MTTYIDGFVLPVPKNRIDDYRELAEIACAIWKEHGCLEYWECVGDDLDQSPECGIRSFTDVVAATDEETVMFSWAVFASREARDAANEKIYADQRLADAMDMNNPVFDMARMAAGGFRVLVRG